MTDITMTDVVMTNFDIMWNNSVNDMIAAIKSRDDIHDYLLSFEPCEYTGYTWTQDEKYKRFSDYLDTKTGCVHSGASFACCVRESVKIIRDELITVKGKPVSDNNENILTITSSSVS